MTPSAPAWSPDGSAIAIGSDKDDTTLVHIISADGKDAGLLAKAKAELDNLSK